ncbi:MAG: ribosome maturation factor [Ginsengibacter sp.]
MSLETPLENIKNFVSGLTSQSETTFPVDVRITPGNQITVLLDDDEGVTIDKCSQVNKALYKYIEDTALFGDSNFSLEVSSPGVGESLKLHRQYKKNTGRSMHIVMNDDSVKEGKLIGVSEEEITIEEKGNPARGGKNNKAITKQITIQFNEIKHATVLITF